MGQSLLLLSTYAVPLLQQWVLPMGYRSPWTAASINPSHRPHFFKNFSWTGPFYGASLSGADCSNVGPPQAATPVKISLQPWWIKLSPAAHGGPGWAPGASPSLLLLWPWCLQSCSSHIFSALITIIHCFLVVFFCIWNVFSQRGHPQHWWAHLWPVAGFFLSQLEPTVCGSSWSLLTEATPVVPVLSKPCHVNPRQFSKLFV